MVSKAKDITILKAEYLKNYTIRFYFSDNKVRDVDFFPFLNKPGQHSLVKKFLDLNKFKKFELKRNEDISWNDYEMCFPFETLYTGKF